jgi:hypothetical protein
MYIIYMYIYIMQNVTILIEMEDLYYCGRYTLSRTILIFIGLVQSCKTYIGQDLVLFTIISYIQL